MFNVFWDFSIFDAQVRCLSKLFTKCLKKLNVLLTMFPKSWNLHCFVTLILTILKNSKYFQCLLWLFDFWCASAVFEHCAFREGPHRAHLGTPWGLWHHMGLGSPMWCHTACGTTCYAQFGATQFVGEWESGEMGRWRNGQTGTWGTGEQRKDMDKWGNGGMGKWASALGTALLVHRGSNTGIIMRACTYTKSCLSNSGACGYSRLTSFK